MTEVEKFFQEHTDSDDTIKIVQHNWLMEIQKALLDWGETLTPNKRDDFMECWIKFILDLVDANILQLPVKGTDEVFEDILVEILAEKQDREGEC